jgi:hypothetical protein
MSELIHSPVAEPTFGDGANRSVTESNRAGSRAFEWPVLGLYALLVGLFASRHSCGFDEIQAWLIARDSDSLASLFHHLRYEGHPALWYLFLYIPAHISWNPLSMQAINWVFAVAWAWLILSARKLHWLIRVLTIFSYYGFYQYGVLPRNYMLTVLLLTAATRCMVGERQHRKLAVLLLALSINAHFFAIPIVAVLVLQMFGISKLKSWKDLGNLLRDSEFLVVSAVMIASVVAVYFTLRPAADLYTPVLYPDEHISPITYYLRCESYLWRALVPPNLLTERIHWLSLLLVRTALGAGLSLAMFLLVAAALKTAQARFVFLAAPVLIGLAMGATVRRPGIEHLGLIFTVFILALLIDAYSVPNGTSHQWLSHRTASAVVFAILGLQALDAAGASAYEWGHPFSYARTISTWFRQEGLNENPLVLMPAVPAFLGYMERRSAYYPACRCEGSFLVWKRDLDIGRGVSEEELESLSHSSPLPVVVVTIQELPAATLQSLHLKELRAFPPISISSGQFFVYEQSAP